MERFTNFLGKIALGLLIAGASAAFGQTISPAGGGGTPASPNKSVQFANSGAFGGNASLLFDSTTHILGFGGLTSSNCGLQQGADHTLGSTHIGVRLGDDSDWCYLSIGGFDLNAAGGSRVGVFDVGGGSPRLASVAGQSISLDPTIAGGNQYLDINGNIRTSLVGGGTLSVAACGGGSPALTSGSTDLAGEITLGTTATGCTLNFSFTRSSAPFCVVSSQTSTTLFSYSTSTTQLIVTNAAASGVKFNYVCFDH